MGCLWSRKIHLVIVPAGHAVALSTIKSRTRNDPQKTPRWFLSGPYVYTAVRSGVEMHATAYPRAQGDECAICLGSLSEGALAVTDCTHLYHFGCIVRWSAQNSTCPLCRTHIGPPNIIEFIEQ